MPIRLLQRFLRLESSSSLLLFSAATIALILANSPVAALYRAFAIVSSFCVNEGLMTLFFLLVGLELKREFRRGELATVSQAMLPGVAALGGIIVPALIYAIFNYHHPLSWKGWAIPVATDIAFALGVLSLFGKRVPLGLKIFLLALAIFDDLGAILIIAVFYVQSISYVYLALATMLCIALVIMNRKQKLSAVPYLGVGVALWFCLWQSGIHPTIAGVLTAFAIPLPELKKREPKVYHFHRLEQELHSWVAFIVMPFFALINAGFSWHGFSWHTLQNNMVIGIILGLFIGKQLGIFVCSWGMIKLGWAKLPTDTHWLAFYGITLLCGIGFSMSLFIGTFLFESTYPVELNRVRFAVVAGSVLSGLAGAMVLWLAFYRGKVD